MNHHRQAAILRRCQLARDNSEPPEYWEDGEDEAEEENEEVDGSEPHKP